MLVEKISFYFHCLDEINIQQCPHGTWDLFPSLSNLRSLILEKKEPGGILQLSQQKWSFSKRRLSGEIVLVTCLLFLSTLAGAIEESLLEGANIPSAAHGALDSQARQFR